MEQAERPDKHKNKVIKVAIVDDYMMLRNFLVEKINAFPNCKVVLSAEDGREFLQGIEQLDVLPDVCFIDISMPKMSGYDTQLAIKKRWPGIKSIALSIHDEPICIFQMIENGASGFIPKNSPVELLYEAILAVSTQGYYYKNVPKDLFAQLDPLPQLTDREKEYLTLLCAEHTMEDIARRLDISSRTVEHYRDNIYRKLSVNNKADLLFYVMRTGIAFTKK